MPDANLSVLVVEDHRETRLALLRLFTSMGCQVDCAASVAEAVGTMDGQDVVVLDWNLPDGTGADVLNWMCGNGFLKPVAVFTASTDYHDLAHQLKSRPDAVFIKPSHLDQLISWIESKRKTV